ncbi:MAG: hypothetical protein BEN19_07405 [Epulopiscium sp. Nuni2H_MBin003]|nr:MAG: hypothetical protein BEN19_07405 [Epulopiscium sp. Nuni2H_MBin003]
MTFLCVSNNYITKIEKIKNNLACQNFTNTGAARPMSLLNNVTNSYGATIDKDNTIHTIAKNTKGQIIYITYANSIINRNVLFEESNFIFDNFYLLYHQNALHFFYTALDTSSNVRSLLHQIISNPQGSVETLVTNFTSDNFDILQDETSIFIIFKDMDKIQYAVLNNEAPTVATLLTSNLPIGYFECAVIDNQIHIVYLQNMYGQSQLIYSNGNGEVTLCTPLKLDNVSILKYLDCIWINYTDNNILYTFISIDNGTTFSKAIQSSIQASLAYTNFISNRTIPLQTNHIFASLSSIIRLPIISSLDIYGINPDLKPNIELEILLEGLKIKILQSAMKNIAAQNQANQAIKQQQDAIKQQQDSTKQIQMMKSGPFVAKEETIHSKPTLEQATKNFMQNLATFDAPMAPPPS